MDAIERLKGALGELDAAIDKWEPARSRDDWMGKQPEARALKKKVEEEVLGCFDEAMADVDDEEVLDGAHFRIADIVGCVATYVYLTGDQLGFNALMKSAKKLARDEAQRDLIEAGLADPDAHVGLSHGRWLMDNERFDDAERVLRPHMASKSPSMARAARELSERPRPIKSAPTMFRFNGCGQSLYGQRDAWPDGSYVATLCFCLVYIPLIPVRAYRVWRDGDSYGFMGTVPLSPFAKWARLGVLIAGLGAGVAAALSAHYGSDTYQLGVALDEAQALEDAGDYESAEARYRAIIDQYDLEQDVSRAELGAIRVVARSVPSPCTAEAVETVSRVVNAFYELPEDDRGPAESFLGARLVTCAEDIDDAEPAAARARLAILDMAMPLRASRAAELRSATLVRLGDGLASSRPLMALTHYMDVPSAGPDVLEKVRKIVDTFGDAPSLWLEAAPQVKKWIAAARNLGPLAETAARYDKSLDAARHEDADDQKLIEAGDETALAAALAAQPDNQALAVAVASAQRQRGELAAAIATLEHVGPPGRMTGLTHQLLGLCYRDADRLKDADALLSPFVEERMSAFQAAQRAYSAAISQAEDKIFVRLNAGAVPPAIKKKLDKAPNEEAQRALVREFVGEEIGRDPHLKDLQDAMLEHEAVVPTAMTLGMVKLARANDASGAPRVALLGEAEKLYLSIRAAAEGQPSYHLGLGEVYHRLGKAAEGDAELSALVEQGDPVLQLDVASIYRSLGKVGRAREIAEKVHASNAKVELKQSAAFLMSLMADSLDEKEKWLKLGDAANPIVKVALIETRGSRAAMAGDMSAADAAYAEAASFWKGQAEHDSTAINNEAVAHKARYNVTGAIAHLKTATTRFEEAVRLSPDAALTVGNLVGALQHLGLVKLLGKHLKVEALAPDDDDAETLVWLLLESDKADTFREAVAKQPELVRALDLARQLEVLAPHSEDGYRYELNWYKWQRDTAGMQKLHDRLAAGQKLDIAETARQRRARERGERDEMIGRDLASFIETNAARLARVRATGHAHTIAAAELLHGWLLFYRYTALEKGDLDESLEHLTAAYEAWPQRFTRESLAGALTQAAALKARSGSPALATAYRDQGRGLELTTLVDQTARGPSSSEVLGALRDQPELAKATELLRQDLATDPSVTFYLAGRWAKDGEVTAAHAAVFTETRARLALAIETFLYPGEAREQADLALYDLAAKDPR